MSAEASIVWVREAQVGADFCVEDVDDEKPKILGECNSVIPTSSRDDMARFGRSSPEAAMKHLKETRESISLLTDTVYCHVTYMPKF